MTSSLNDKISKCKALLEALEVIAEDESLAGALKVSAGSLKGAVAFADGKLMGAFVNAEDGRGQPALDKLLATTEPTIRYAKFDYKQLSGAERIELDIRELVAELKKPQLSLLEQLAFSDEDEEEADSNPKSDEKVEEPETEKSEKSEKSEEQDKSAETVQAEKQAEERAEEQTEAHSEEPSEEESEHESEEHSEQHAALEADESGEFNSEHYVHISTEEEKEAFFASDESMQEEALSEAQRMLLEAFSTTEWDKAVFEQSDPKLQDSEEEVDLMKSQMEMIINTKFDAKPFETSDVPLEKEGLPSLSPDQKRALEMMAEAARDKDAFEEMNAALESEGLELSTEELRDLGEALLARSREEQEEEFALTNEKLNVEESLPPVTVEEPVAPAVVHTTEELDAIKTPEVTAEDYAPLPLISEMKKLPERKGTGGLLGRMRDGIMGKPPGYDGERIERKPFPVGRVLGGATMVAICVALFTVPGMIRTAATGKTSEQLADEQLQQVVREETTVRPQKPAPPNANAASYAGQGSSSGAIGGGSYGSDEAPPSAIQNDPLAYARSLVAEGKVGNAVPNYEAYISKNPDNIQVRIEYIRALIAMNKRDRACQQCLAALKRKLTDTELVTINALMRQCAFAN